MNDTRAVCLNCIDGRVQLPAIDWIKQKFKVDYVDMITAPGVDGFLADPDNSLDNIFRNIKISIEYNKAHVIVVVGHDDCKGNSVSESAHKEHIQKAVKRLKEVFSDITITGLWINSELRTEEMESL